MKTGVAVRARRVAGPAAAALVLGFAAWTVGLFRFAAAIPERVADADTATEAVVVLTGGTHRLAVGVDLLTLEKGRKLFVSGVYQGVDVRRLLALFQHNPRELEERIAIGNAVNTAENASETAEWIRKQGFNSLRLVTAAYHMPRSLLEFRHAMPRATIIPHPVFPEHVKAKWWAWPGTLSLIAGEYNKFLFAWVRHRAERLTAGTPP
jgi:uncharacterized SAM-binding protein YcdF (DUF218 family)